MKSLKDYFLKAGILKEEEWRRAEELQKKKGLRIDRVLLEEGMVDEYTLLKAYSQVLNLPLQENVEIKKLDPAILKVLPLHLLKNYHLLPINISDGEITLATSDPLSLTFLHEIPSLTGKETQLVLMPEEEIRKGLEHLSHPDERTTEEVFGIMEEERETVEEGREKIEDLLDMAHKAPVIKLVNLILYQALEKRATDIHIEPQEKKLRVRYRIDGLLYDVLSPPLHYAQAIISRIKVMASLNIAERRLPQDGRFKIRRGKEEVDVRVSIIPVTWGERVVLRLLNRANLLDLAELGLSKENYRVMEKLIHLPYGIILVTGPTGSGKTTTLYAALSRINSPEKNIITIEDPVEYQLPGIAQIQVKPSIGLTFSKGLRSVLRHDPDVLMVGEMRDRETAEIAIRASLTGHLVFSTLHTNDAASAITRLLDIGIEPYLVASSVRAIIAQRLVRKICPYCKKEVLLEGKEWMNLGDSHPPTKVWRGEGCDKCLNTGYLGRTGIYEILLLDSEIRKMITEKVEAHIIKRRAVEKGMKTLRMDGLDKVREGITTLEEVMRVTQEVERY